MRWGRNRGDAVLSEYPESHAAVGEDRSRELAADFTFRNNFNAPQRRALT